MRTKAKDEDGDGEEKVGAVAQQRHDGFLSLTNGQGSKSVAWHGMAWHGEIWMACPGILDVV